MKRNGDSERWKRRDNGIRNGDGRISQTVGGNDLFGTGIGGLLSWWDKTARSGGFRRVPLIRVPH